MTRVLSCTFALFTALMPITWLAADEPTAEENNFFETKIRPVLVEHCHACHAADAKNIRGGLLLDTRAGIRRGGESGPAVVPHDIDASLLIAALRHESFEMPPDRKLSKAIIADFEKWIVSGAPDPRQGDSRALPVAVDVEAGRDFWCYQPIAPSEVPAVKNTDWPATDVDRFVLNRLEANDLMPVADADRRTLLRRVYFDLIGLPPTPEQIAAFLQNESPEAFEEVVGTGRDHNPDGFSVFLAGGGVKPGFSYGATDEFGHHAVEGKVHMHDLHATILHLLGLDHERLTFRHAGRDFRLTDVQGRVVDGIFR